MFSEAQQILEDALRAVMDAGAVSYQPADGSDAVLLQGRIESRAFIRQGAVAGEYAELWVFKSDFSAGRPQVDEIFTLAGTAWTHRPHPENQELYREDGPFLVLRVCNNRRLTNGR